MMMAALQRKHVAMRDIPQLASPLAAKGRQDEWSGGLQHG
jgi:hypothetical protein